MEKQNPSLKDEQILQQRFGSGGGERYYGGSSGMSERSSHYYTREPTHDDRDRDLSSLSNSSSGSGHRRSQEPPEVDRGMFINQSIIYLYNINVSQSLCFLYIYLSENIFRVN